MFSFPVHWPKLGPSLLLILSACSSGGDGGGGSNGKTCQDAFSPEKVEQGQDCSTVIGSYCPQQGSIVNQNVLPCDGVEVTRREVVAGNLSSEYLVIRKAGGRPKSIYLALHYLSAGTESYANVTRLPELAKARDVLVLVPQAPPLLLDDNLLSRWPIAPEEDVDAYVALLDAVVADARSAYGASSLPLYVAGLSNGAAMVYFYGCRAADRVDAILSVAGTFSRRALEVCQPPVPIGTVLVHGTADIIVPYGGTPVYPPVAEVHAFFEQVDGCAGQDRRATIQASSTDFVAVNIDYSARCDGGRRNYLVSLEGGGHNWPGKLQESPLPNFGLLGAQTTQFDATLQGYDLLEQAAGD